MKRLYGLVTDDGEITLLSDKEMHDCLADDRVKRIKMLEVQVDKLKTKELAQSLALEQAKKSPGDIYKCTKETMKLCEKVIQLTNIIDDRHSKMMELINRCDKYKKELDTLQTLVLDCQDRWTHDYDETAKKAKKTREELGPGSMNSYEVDLMRLRFARKYMLD